MNEGKKTISMNLKINEKKFASVLDLEKYFCLFCLQYPEYTIEISNNGNISISHLCYGKEKIKIDLSNIENFKSNINNKLCVNCKSSASNICSKCGEFICDKCVMEHESTRGFLNCEYL